MRLGTRGFTLVEMMVVLTVSLILMTMVVPIFRVSTKTVQVIERKLAVYDAARNLLDLIDNEVRVAAVNEHGNHWSIKHTTWMDTDTFTPDSPSPPLYPGATDTASLAFKQSRRFADALDYIRLEGGGMSGGPRTFPGGKSFPTAYPVPVWDDMQPEAYKASMRSTLLYQHILEWYSQDYDSDQSLNRWTRPEQLADVGQIELAFIYYASYDQWYQNQSAGNGNKHYDQVTDFYGPGKEIRCPMWYRGNIGGTLQHRLGQMKIMDLSISYWDDSAVKDGGKQFKDLPDNTVVYFWPAPKAIRVTITVCDREKRDTVTLCRIIPILTGLGTAQVNTGVSDFAYYTPNLAPFSATNPPAIYNRAKYMPKLPPGFNGDASYPSGAYSFDQSVSSEDTTMKTDTGVKPYNWP